MITLLVTVNVPAEPRPFPGETPPPISKLTPLPTQPLPPILPERLSPPRTVTGLLLRLPLTMTGPSQIRVALVKVLVVLMVSLPGPALVSFMPPASEPVPAKV